jgi:hypothetical protein
VGKVYVYSPGLSREDSEHMGMVKIDNVQETVDQLLKDHSSAVVIPEGPYVVGMVQ